MNKPAGRLSGISFVVATVALIVGFAHYWFGPIEAPPTVEQVAAGKVVAIGQAAWARLHHRAVPDSPERDDWGPDRAIQAGSSLAGALALLLAAVAYARGERKRLCIAAGAVSISAALFPIIGFLALVGLIVLVFTFLPVA